MKRKGIEFTSKYAIHVYQGEDGRYWSVIARADSDEVVWEYLNDTDDRSEAFDLACNRMDAMCEEFLNEQETEEIAQTNDEKQRDVGISNKSFLY